MIFILQIVWYACFIRLLLRIVCIRQVLATEKPLKDDEKYVLFDHKSSFRSQETQIFVLTIFSVTKTACMKDEVDFKIYDVWTWEQTIAIHILFNISTSKGNQTKTFLSEYNLRCIFLAKSYAKPQTQISSLNCYTGCFYCMPASGLSKYTETKLQTTCFYLI